MGFFFLPEIPDSTERMILISIKDLLTPLKLDCVVNGEVQEDLLQYERGLILGLLKKYFPERFDSTYTWYA